VKISDGDANRLAGVPFMITSKSTGESHVVVTDRNGEFSTASSWNPHNQNTNRGKSDRDGVWFGEMRTLDDSLGALLYDDYVIEELPCDANEGLELLAIEVSIYRHMTVIDLGTLTDDYIQVPEIFTTALDQESTTNEAHVSEETIITDTVYYSGLKVGKDYTVKGILLYIFVTKRCTFQLTNTLIAAGIIFIALLVLAIVFFIRYSKTKKTPFLILGIIFIALIAVVVIYGLAAVLLIDAIE
jgi:hypothetical protein